MTSFFISFSKHPLSLTNSGYSRLLIMFVTVAVISVVAFNFRQNCRDSRIISRINLETILWYLQCCLPTCLLNLDSKSRIIISIIWEYVVRELFAYTSRVWRLFLHLVFFFCSDSIYHPKFVQRSGRPCHLWSFHFLEGVWMLLRLLLSLITDVTMERKWM